MSTRWSHDRAAKRRPSVARGVSPWTLARSRASSPEGAKQAYRDFNADRIFGFVFQALTPLATNARPFGTGVHRRQCPVSGVGFRGLARRGFTLTELMVVIAIIVVITIAVLPAVLHALEDRKFSESARSIQAAFAAARDRAIVSGQIRGLRLVRDDTDQWEVSSLVYIGVPEPYTVGTVSVAAGSHTVNAAPMSPNPYWNQADPVTGTERVPGALAGLDTKPGVAGIDDDGDGMLDNATELGWAGSDDVVQSHIRFNNTGRLYAIRSVTSATSLELVATEPAPPAYSGVPYQIYLPPVPLPNVQAVKLPDGVVIDVRGLSVPAPNNFPRSRYIPTQDLVTGNMDILFGPDGFVTGPAAAQPFVHFWVGARADKIATRVHDLVTLNTRTGSVHVYGNPDPNAPSPYAPAERALGVSILDVP